MIFPKRNVADYEIESVWAIEGLSGLRRSSMNLHAWIIGGKLRSSIWRPHAIDKKLQRFNFEVDSKEERDIMDFYLRDC